LDVLMHGDSRPSAHRHGVPSSLPEVLATAGSRALPGLSIYELAP
jgi:hypothetical protein